MLTLKISLGIFFLKIFNRAGVWQRYIIHGIMWFSVAMGLVLFFLSIFTCGVLPGFGASTEGCPIAPAYNGLSIFWSSINATTDLMFSVLSVQALWNAQLPRVTKISACALLLFGTIGGIASVVRIVELFSPRSGVLQAIDAAYWTLLEAGVGITAASCATLRPLLRFVGDRVHKTVTSIKVGSNASAAANTLVHTSRIGNIDSTLQNDLEKGESRDMEKSDAMKTIVATTTVSIVEDKDEDGSLLQAHDLA